jgi:hypothetical protein
MWMRHLPLAVALPFALTAQTTAPTARLSGVAFDSVARAPLAHAIVQAILVDSSAGRSLPGRHVGPIPLAHQRRVRRHRILDQA